MLSEESPSSFTDSGSNDRNVELPKMYQSNYDPRSALWPADLRKTFEEAGRNDPGIAQRIGEQVIYYTWLAGLTTMTITLVYAIVRKMTK